MEGKKVKVKDYNFLKNKIIAVILIGLSILILSLAYNNVFALSTNENGYLGNIGYVFKMNTSTDYYRNSNMFCIQHNQNLKTNNYTVVELLNIEGNEATDSKGNLIVDDRNAVLAYLLTYNHGDGGYVKTRPYGSAVRLVWHYFAKEWKNVFTNVNDIPTYIGTDTEPLNDGDKAILNEAKNYAQSLKDIGNQGIRDNTNKNTLTSVSSNNKTKVGPFNWTFSVELADIKIYDQNGSKIENISFSVYNGTEEVEKAVNEIESDKDFYISFSANQNTGGISKVAASTAKNTKGVKITFLEHSGKGNYQHLIYVNPYEADSPFESTFEYDISIKGNLKIVKIRENDGYYDEEIVLRGVGFVIKNEDTGLYVKRSSNGTITYVGNRNSATEFITNSRGIIEINDLMVGRYVAYETKNPNMGYEVSTSGYPTIVEADKTIEFKISNKQIYIDMSGYVWLDSVESKESLRNNLYDRGEERLDDIVVKLMNADDEVIMRDETDNHGEYEFKRVPIGNGESYYIQFEYDGLEYTNVDPKLNKSNGSKAEEGYDVRERFNEDFSTIIGNERNRDEGYAIDDRGRNSYDLDYDIDENNHVATFINRKDHIIYATTREAGFDLLDEIDDGEIENINLGVYIREQPDMALINDIENVRIEINGQNQTYLYSQRFVNQGEYGDGFDIGVKFGEKYGSMSYSRAVYKADYEYRSNDDTSREMKIYITYRIGIKNQSTNLMSKVNSIVNYYDENYDINAVGYELDNVGNINDRYEIDFRDIHDKGEDDDYKKVVIDTDMEIDAQTVESIYIQYILEREAVERIVNNKENLDVVSEINSYSTYDDENDIYAGIDKDSNPGNADPHDKDTYEDDTDLAPGIKLVLAEDRNLVGVMFEDSTADNLMSNQIRQGDGIYDPGTEEKVRNVNVVLQDVNNANVSYSDVTDENGNYEFGAFPAGDYVVKYNWGDETYPVQNYKATIYDERRDESNKDWHELDVDIRKSDAMDNYEIRQAIDNELKDLNYSSQTTIDKMESITPVMALGVENTVTNNPTIGEKYIYNVENVDFGIVERARQSVSIEKRISEVKLTTPSGQVMVDVMIDENGNISGQKGSLTYMRQSNSVSPKNGYVKIELDQELTQGAALEVVYDYVVKNISELDYLTEEYYDYGSNKDRVVELKATGVIDYLDSDWAFEENSNWKITNLTEMQDLLSDEVKSNQLLNDRKILYSDGLSSVSLIPNALTKTNLDVSKLLSNTEDIVLENEVEIVQISKTGGSELNTTLGNYEVGNDSVDSDEDIAEILTITPNTGADLDYILPIGIVIISLGVLAIGTFIIKKKVVNK